MEGYWVILFMLIALKIPAIGMIWLLYWAARHEQEDGVLDEGEDDGGSKKRRARPLLPRGPRRDPHGGGAVKSPRRARDAKPAIGPRIRSGLHPPEPARAREHEPSRD
jgi:hypothetical protein